MSGATTTPTLDQPPKVPPKPLSPLVDGATQSASPVTGGSAVFLINQRSLAGGTGGAASPSTAPVTQPAATQATQSPDAWNAASGTLAAVESQLAQLKVWAAPDAAAFEAALGTLKSDAAQGKYAEAPGES